MPHPARHTTAEPPAASGPQAAAPAKKAHGWTLTFSYATLSSGAIVLAITTLWVFVLGFMAGKGQNPHSKWQELTGQNAPAASQPAPAVPAPPAAAQPAVAAEAKAAQTVPPGAAIAPEQKSAPAPKPAPAPSRPQEPKFAFVYQLAAFRSRDTDSLKATRAKLEAAGYRIRQEKRGKLTFLLAHLRGTEEDAAALRAACARLRLGSPLLRSRTAISTDRKS